MAFQSNIDYVNVSNEQLMLYLTQGKEMAFSEIYGRFSGRIYWFFYHRIGQNGVKAEDLTQDICAALPTKLRHWRGEARFTTWLYRVVINATHDARRRLATRTRAANGWGDWEKSRQAEAAEAAQAQDWLANAMAQLNEDLRDTLALTLGEDLTQAEAADVLGVSEGTVAWRMSEVKKKLRAMAAEEGTA